MTSATLVGAVLAVLAGAQVGERPALLPAPRSFTALGGSLAVQAPVELHVTHPDAASAVEVLERVFGAAGQGGARVTLASTDEDLGPEGYELEVSADGIAIRARGAAGLFYGAHTLRQLWEASPGELPLCRIVDWPDMRWRGTDYEVTRPEDLQRLAGLKMNLVVWEVSGRFASPSHPELAGDLSLDELAAICAEARRNHITLILHIQSFGHAHWLLTPHPELRADPESTHTIRTDRPEVYEILDDLYGELIAASGAPYFFPGCDEPWQIDNWCKERGLDPAEVVGEHIARLAAIAKKHGARIMVWGDYLLKYPDALGRFSPEDVSILDWHYEPVTDYPSVDVFVNAGFETLVAPSAAPGEALFPDYDQTTTNILNFVAEGKRRGAAGMLNTNWPTGPMPLEALWYGWALAADAAWSSEPVHREEFDQRYASLAFGGDPEGLAQYLEWTAANRGWRKGETPSASAHLRTMADQDAFGVIGLEAPEDEGPIEGLLRRTDDLAARNAGDAHPGWADLAAIAESIGASVYSQRRNALLARAYGALTLVSADPGDPDAGAHLSAAGEALEQLARIVREGDTDAQHVVQIALTNLPEAPGPECDPSRVFGVTGDAESGTSEINVSACVRGGETRGHGESGIIIPRRGTALDLAFATRRDVDVRVWALLRHSAGIWEDGAFARGGRNSAYEGRYGLTLDGRPLTETWWGEELNPDDDEALQWTLLYEGQIAAGEHSLGFRPEGINFAIVERVVFTDLERTPDEIGR